MTYIDKRALQNGESELSIIPYVNLNQVIQDIIDPQVFPTPSEDISFSTQEIGTLDISELNGQYFTALDLGVFSTTNSLEDVAEDIPPCTFGTMVFTVTDNSADEDLVVWLLSGEDIIGSITVPSGETGDFSVTRDFENPEYLSICFNVTGGSGEIVISEITTTFTTGEPINPPEPPVEFTAGDWMSIEDGVVSFSGGVVTKEKRLTTEVSTGATTKYASRTFGVSAIDRQEFSIVDNSLTTNSSAYYVGANELLFTISEYSGGRIDITNEFRVSAADVSMSAYPNTRNDFPADPPVNLLCTNEDGKIQSYNTGVTATISMLGATLKFVNGVLVEYTT